MHEKLTVSRRRLTRTHHEVYRPLLIPDGCLRMSEPKKDAQGRIIEQGTW